MPLVSFGFCFPQSVKKQRQIKNIITLIIDKLFDDERLEYQATYVYDEDTDLPVILKNIDFIWDNQMYGHYNKSVYTIGLDEIEIHITKLGEDIAIEMSVDYDMLIDSKPHNKEMVSHIESCFEEIYADIEFRFAFLDFDSQCDIAYDNLLHTVKNFRVPYTLLMIDDDGLKKYNSGFDLLGIPII